MQKTLIEWVKNPDGTQGYTWNPITGCLNHIDGLCKGGGFPCYAFKLANGRLRARYLANHNIPDKGFSIIGGEPVTLAGCGFLYEKQLNDPFYPRFWPERLQDFGRPDAYGQQIIRNPKGIFVCDMGELFGDWIPTEWQAEIFDLIKRYPEHRFYLLTKQPQNLIKFSPFPENCWVGVTATDSKMVWNAYADLATIYTPVKFLSLEPLLGQIDTRMIDSFKEIIKWLIIGACTGTLEAIKKLLMLYPQLDPKPYGKIWTLQPKIEWVEEIVRACDKAGIPIFLKYNLYPLFNDKLHYPLQDWLRQEIPE